MKKDDLLEVEAFIYGIKIGTLAMLDGKVYFEYDPNFKDNNLEISPIKLNTKDIKDTYLNSDYFDIYHGMAGVFFDSLPDKHGMPFIYRYFESKGFKESEVSLLHKLTFIADRGMGAIEYKPKEHQDPVVKIGLVESVKSLRDGMNKIFENNASEYSIDMLMNIIDSASPIGGARPKMLILFNSQTRQIKYNNKSLEQGFKRAIIKFDEVYPDENLINKSLEFTKLEYLFMDIAKDCGIEIPNILLFEEQNQHHLILERYDRDRDDNKIHICSASGLMHKDISVAKVMSYEELFAFTNKICAKQSEINQLYKRMIFNVLCLNFDDHAKNFEFMMDRRGEWSLAPAYDVTYSKGALKEHLTTINGKGKDFVIDDFLKIASENLIDKSKALTIISTMASELSTFKERAEKLDISTESINECWDDIQEQLNLVKFDIPPHLLATKNIKDMSGKEREDAVRALADGDSGLKLG
ncbi:MAG: serine/threonine-protein kinase HipA [Campylobacterota bacterium]|nr:serine/threonine-protein kinase HipA [Campylobacterota bacterium]